jgi:hypothetical protein
VPVPLSLLAGFGVGASAAGTVSAVGRGRTARAARNTPEAIAEKIASDDPVSKLEGLIRAGKRIEGGQRRARKGALNRRLRAARKELTDAGGENLDAAFGRATAKLSGDLPRGSFDSPLPNFTPEEINGLHQRVLAHPSLQGEFATDALLDTRRGMVKALTGELPTKSELAKLQKVFGDDFVEALLDKRSRGQKFIDGAMDAANLPRAVMSSFDLSAPFRQGALLSSRKEFWQGFGPMVKAFGSEDYALAVERDLLERAGASRRSNAGLHQSPLGRGVDTKLTSREESFMSNMAESIPLVRRSERAFVTFLNKLRADTFDSVAAKLEANGEGTTERFEQLASWLNNATGRGNLPEHELLAGANALFFSPRLFMSRLDLITGRAALKAGAFESKTLRMEVARDMVAFVGAGVAALTMLKFAGDSLGFPVSIELDPRSSDFGKGKVGTTRYDPWAGFQPIARYVAQFMSGERKSSTGRVTDQNRAITAGRLAQSKLAPIPGALVDLMRGETFIGESADFTKGETISKQAASRMTPLFVQDILEASREAGMQGAFKTLPAGVGFGVGTYDTISAARDRLAQEEFGFQWNELSGSQKDKIAAENEAELKRVAGEPEADGKPGWPLRSTQGRTPGK